MYINTLHYIQLGIILGFDSFWKLVSSWNPNDTRSSLNIAIGWFCRLNNVFVLGIGHSATTSLIVFIMVQRITRYVVIWRTNGHGLNSCFSTLLQSKNGPAIESTRLLSQQQSSYYRQSAIQEQASAASINNNSIAASSINNNPFTQPQPSNWWEMSFSVSVFTANLQVLWKAFIVTLLVFLLQAAVILMDALFKGLDFVIMYNFAFLAELFSRNRVQCVYPVIPAGIAAVNMFVFILVYSKYMGKKVSSLIYI